MNVTLENTEAPAITPAMLAELVLGTSHAVIVQDATGTVHSLRSGLNRCQLDDPDTVVLLTRGEAVAVLEEQAQAATQALRAAGVIL